MMDTNEFLAPFERMLSEVCTSAAVREIEEGGNSAAMWEAFEASGFLDALVGEEQGGVGLALSEVGPLFMAIGRHGVPLPVGETILARHLLAAMEAQCPAGPVALAMMNGKGAARVICGGMADHILIEADGKLALIAARDLALRPSGGAYDVDAILMWNDHIGPGTIAAPPGGLLSWSAGLRACLMSGAAERLLEMTVSYANERVQFGKPIGAQQALQQNLAVMAEHVIALRLAAQSVCAAGLPMGQLTVAIAKQISSAFAPAIANTAHAVHGAIGISREHDLQLLTRRLHGWRQADGAERLWACRLGEARLSSPAGSLDFVRTLAGGSNEPVNPDELISQNLD